MVAKVFFKILIFSKPSYNLIVDDKAMDIVAAAAAAAVVVGVTASQTSIVVLFPDSSWCHTILTDDF